MSADRDWNTRDADDGVISGHVVAPADDDTLDEDTADDEVTSTPAPETYLHKVAGPPTDQAPPAEDPDEPGDAVMEDRTATADPARTDPDLLVPTDLRDTDLADTDPEGIGPAYTDPAGTDLAYADAADAGTQVTDPPDTALPDADMQVADMQVAGRPGDRRPGDETSLTSSATSEESLLGDTTALLAQWKQAQAGFVEDPRASVNEAAGVVADAASRLESAIRERQQNLRGEWDGDGNADTEMLRQAMLVYRRLLDKLVAS
jgi:hypothetical protein